MKKFKTLFLISMISLFFVACEKKSTNQFAKMHWDRDACERCVMVVSEKSYAVQIQDPTTKRHYKFDDIGCAILWFKESQKNWFDNAIIWVKDEKSKEWIDARQAFWTNGNITPMNYGLAAYTVNTLPKDKEKLTFIQAIESINIQDEQDRLRRQHQLHKKGEQ